MPADPRIVRVPLTSLHDLSWGGTRRGEPVTVGVPLPWGAAPVSADIALEDSEGRAVPIEVRPLDFWPDGSPRWVLIRFAADAVSGRAVPYTLVIEPGRTPSPAIGMDVTEPAGGVRVTTRAATFECVVGESFPLSRVTVPGRAGGDRRAALRLALEGRTHQVTITAVVVHERGPLRAEVEVRGRVASAGVPLEATATIELFAGAPAARVDLTLRNPRRARHRGGQWSLGDPGSLLLDSAVVAVDLGVPIDEVWCAVEPGQTLEPATLPFEIYQESSGGERWSGPIHRNREGRVPLRFCGYRRASGDASRAGRRASPIVMARAAETETVVALPQFWEQFPRAIRVDGQAIEIGLFPSQYGDHHELQGGEQKTHRMVLAFGTDRVSDPPLAWVHDPIRLTPDPGWSCATGAVPFLSPAREADPGYAGLVAAALDPDAGLLAKREIADEYGWRHFGDLYADHESAFRPPDEPFVSHYNNQYDAIAAFAVHFLRSGDDRWWRLMDDLARHVRDIDIYHTEEDKSAYNGGLFWHTAHYLDAGLSTHRTYPPGSNVGGGPSAEHNYNVGLMLHYVLTGERRSRDAAIGLGAWVIEMDDGAKTPFRWLAPGPTGHASLTRDYHGPGRGAGHSILACLVAGRLSGDPRYAAKADELIARAIHPTDDVDARHLLDAERRWSYTAFLQVLGLYLHGKAERGEFDAPYGYARASLLHYARWMAGHERPYLDHPGELEYPTETWAAQELRKADVFFWAALHADGAERERFLDRARFFFDYAIQTLGGMAERRFTRPLILVLVNGLRLDWLLGQSRELPRLARVEFTPPPRQRPFMDQRRRAVRRAGRLILLAIVAVVILSVVWLSG